MREYVSLRQLAFVVVANENTQEVKNERFLMRTRQNNVGIFGIHYFFFAYVVFFWNAFFFANQDTQEAKNERFLMCTRQNNVGMFGILCLFFAYVVGFFNASSHLCFRSVLR